MEFYEHDNIIEITGISDFDLYKTFECGQCFRWSADNNGVYTGVAYGKAVKLRKNGKSIFITCSVSDFNEIWIKYFDLKRDYAVIRKQLCIDDFMKTATEFGEGIRILRQDKWEALCSFIISQNNNISRIKKIIASLCRWYGDDICFEGERFYSFPSAVVLSGLNISDLADLRCGYRAGYILSAAKAVASGEINLNNIAVCSQEKARFELKKLYGVGDKVADCVMLFGLHNLDVFPLDVWMKRAVAKYYGPGFDPDIFSPYAGIAQQYIFHFIRNS